MFQEKSAMLSEEDRAWEQSPRVPGTQAPGWDTAQCSTTKCTTSIITSIMSTEICTETQHNVKIYMPYF